MKLYCSNCGLQLKTIRKAVPKLGTILDLVEPHTCLESPVDPSTLVIVASPFEGEQKFVKSINKLGPSPFQPLSEGSERMPSRSTMTGTDDLRDRRFDQEPKIPSTAPRSVIDQIKTLHNSIPSHELKDDTTDSEMGG